MPQRHHEYVLFLSQKYLIFSKIQNIVSLMPKTMIKLGHNTESNFMKVPESNKNRFFRSALITWERKMGSIPVGKFQFSSIAQSCPTLCDSKNRNTPGFPVHHRLLEFTQTHVHWVSDAIQPSHPLSSPSLPSLNLSQHQGFFKCVSSSHQVAKVLEFQLQHQSFQWTPRTDFF